MQLHGCVGCRISLKPCQFHHFLETPRSDFNSKRLKEICVQVCMSVCACVCTLYAHVCAYMLVYAWVGVRFMYTHSAF